MMGVVLWGPCPRCRNTRFVYKGLCWDCFEEENKVTVKPPPYSGSTCIHKQGPDARAPESPP